MLYTSVQNSKIRDIKKLHNKKERDNKNEFIIEGEHLVLEAYKRGLLKELILNEKSVFSLKVPTIYVNNVVNNFLSELSTPSLIMGICKKEDTKCYGNKILMLDGIQDPGNLGTIIRSAVAFKVDTIILGDGTVDVYNSKTLRASQGMIFNINIVAKNLKKEIPLLKKNNYQIYGTKLDNSNNIRNIKMPEKYAIIMGNEGNGIDYNILSLCDKYLYIDMAKECESLNVAVATSIILYELSR